MAWYRAGGGGIPSSLKTGMNSVLNKKFGTTATYDPAGWPDDVNLLGKLPEKTVSGTIAHITDGADTVPIKSWEVTLPALLDGYTEVNGVRTGKNLWNVTAITNTTHPNNATIVNNGNGTITVTTTTQQNVKTAQKLKDICPNVKVGETYFLNATTTGNQKIIYLHQAAVSWTYGTAKVITSQMLESDVSLYASHTNSTATISDLSLTYGSTATAYEAYEAPTQYTASLGRTIYGGTADVVKGTGTENYAKIVFDADNKSGWQLSNGIFYYDVTANSYTKNIDATNYLCDTLTSVKQASNISDMNTRADNSIALYGNTPNYWRVFIKKTDLTTLEAFQTWISSNPVTFVYQVGTPSTFTFDAITPTPETALGTNNFWADTGDSEVTYRADIDLLLGGN